MFYSCHEFPYNFLNHDSLFSHFSFFLESIEILKLCVAKIIIPNTYTSLLSVLVGFLGSIVNC